MLPFDDVIMLLVVQDFRNNTFTDITDFDISYINCQTFLAILVIMLLTASLHIQSNLNEVEIRSFQLLPHASVIFIFLRCQIQSFGHGRVMSNEITGTFLTLQGFVDRRLGHFVYMIVNKRMGIFKI